MKRIMMTAVVMLMASAAALAQSKVYLTREISPESLVKIYKASTDPVALDQACIDIINQQEVTAKNDPTDLLNRIDKQHGIHTIEHAEKIGLGSRKYTLVSIDQ